MRLLADLYMAWWYAQESKNLLFLRSRMEAELRGVDWAIRENDSRLKDRQTRIATSKFAKRLTGAA